MSAQTDTLHEMEPLGTDTEYQYFVHAKEVKTFANIIRRYGVMTNQEVLTPHMVFTSPRRLDLREFKEKGLIRSYSIVQSNERVVEQG